MMRSLVILLCLGLLTACAPPAVRTEVLAPKTAQGTLYRAQGRMGIHTPEQGFTLGFHIQLKGEWIHLDLFGPAGERMAVLTGTENALTLTEAKTGKVYQGTAQQLMLQHLGFALPLKSLAYWLKGQANPALTVQEGVRNDGKLTRFVQANWQITLKSFEAVRGDTYPRGVQLTHGDLKARIAVTSWE